MIDFLLLFNLVFINSLTMYNYWKQRDEYHQLDTGHLSPDAFGRHGTACAEEGSPMLEEVAVQTEDAEKRT